MYAKHSDIPEAKGLFNPENDKDACGVGFVADLSKEHSRKTVSDALEMLVRMKHRGACGCEENTGASINVQVFSQQTSVYIDLYCVILLR